MRDGDVRLVRKRLVARLAALARDGSDLEGRLKDVGLFDPEADEVLHRSDYDRAEWHLNSASPGVLTAAYESLYARPFVETPEPWEEGRFRLFISHISEHRVLANDLKTELASYGISAFVAHDDIEPADEWQPTLEGALASCHGLAALLTPGFHESKWTDQEAGIAFGRGVTIVAVMLGLAPYGFIGKFQGFQAKDTAVDVMAEKVFAILARNRQSSATLAAALIDQLEESQHFKDANRTIALVDAIKDFPSELADSLEFAEDYSGEVRGGWHVSSGVLRILGRVSRSGSEG